MLDSQGLHLRAALFRSIRQFFAERQFLEVDTPIRQPVLIPEHTIEPIEAGSWFLQASPEQCMKRLMATGENNIFQLSHCFRKGEIGKKHLEEFTMLEWYRMDSDYHQLMDDCQDLFRSIVIDLSADPRFKVILQNSCLPGMDVNQRWDRLSVRQAFESLCPVSAEQALMDDRFDELMVEYIEPGLGWDRPLFLYDYPVQCGSLARIKESDARVVERFEVYVNGLELANGFSELTDVDEQRLRFQDELARIETGGGWEADLPLRFLEDLEHIDRAAGIAMGVDRLLMLVMSAESIEDVVPFSPGDW